MTWLARQVEKRLATKRRMDLLTATHLEPPGAERPRTGEPPRLHPDRVLPLSTAKGWLSTLLHHAQARGQRFLITKRGQVVGAVICARDLERLEKYERAAQTDLFRET